MDRIWYAVQGQDNPIQRWYTIEIFNQPEDAEEERRIRQGRSPQSTFRVQPIGPVDPHTYREVHGV